MQGKNDQGREPADFAEVKDEVADRLQQEKQSAAEALHDARDEVARRTSDYASEAREALSERADEMQRDIGSSAAALGGALRAASDHLADKEQSAAAKFMLDAAGGLERLSSSLKEKPFGQVLEEVQSFGRQNPGVLLAGSVLAGLALGRFMKAAPPEAHGSAQAQVGHGETQKTGVKRSHSREKATSSSGSDGGTPARAEELKG
ncbi:hypothetical protein [Mesorhizobium sp. WSM1497]|uniref:hypothetical protein n=1 Tax=Mesorhizobium sp. WSM1497 TaxID=278153 RepID=UPI000A4C18EF|nr:hypothetical protein [Mesorhizobium sp. WSM1497]